ncbi:MAG: hypothetical protein K0R54_592 [Clostridiaceae bacterium]|jgi:DNA polymerase-3 subunit alpha (Gram-positive type)|nr:hypothetical protein [Clostridiaceae bacterium]
MERKKCSDNELVSLLLSNNEFVILDIETSGLSPDKGGRIIEIGAVKIRGTKIIEKYSQLIYPEQKIYAKTIELTGITNEMLQGMPVYAQVLPEFHKFIGDNIIVAHNAGFDWDRFLLKFFLKVGIIAKNQIIDTVQLSKYIFPNKKKHNLEELCNELNIKITNHHRAFDDCLVTAKALLKLKKILINRGMVATGPISTQTTIVNINEIKSNEAISDKIKIKRVKYWEKQKTKNESFKRIYVTLNNGTAFFDIPTMTWQFKDIQNEVNKEILQNSVLKYLKLNTVEELCNYRN